MAIDLSALEDFDQPIKKADKAPAAAGGQITSGKPMELPLAEIEEDPNQPRREFDEEAMQSMVASVKASGVISPISVRPHPARGGGWMINHGARRYRASVAAGKKTIPAFVSEVHDDYDQIVENLVRDDLTPMELAQFIRQKLDAGDSKSKIAKRLSKSAKFITLHLALIDPPTSVSRAYSEGKTTSMETLYNLRMLAEKYPEQVAEWVDAQQEISRSSVDALELHLAEPSDKAPSKFSHEKISEEGSDSAGQPHSVGTPSGNVSVENIPAHNPEHEKALKTAKKDDPDAIKKAVLLVEYDGRPAMVLLNRKPSTLGLLHVKYEDTGDEIEADAARCKIQCLIEAKE